MNGGLAIVGVGSALHWPALSVPSGYLGENLPQGLQILGQNGRRIRSSALHSPMNRPRVIAGRRRLCHH